MLPPSEWDPSQRLDPPEKVPSQQLRRTGSFITIESGPSEESNSEEIHQHDSSLTRTGRFCGGLIADVKRKLPLYWSDYRDAFHYQCLASFFFLYLASLAPAITFGGIMGKALEDWMV